MAETLQFAVRLLHILFGVAWVGSALLLAWVAAAARDRDPRELPDTELLNAQGKAIRLFAVAGPLTLLLGVWNQYLIAGAISYQGGLWNLSLGAAFFLTLLMVGINHGLQLPAHRKLTTLGPDATGADAEDLQKRVHYGTLATAGIGVVAVALMVLAVMERTGAV